MATKAFLLSLYLSALHEMESLGILLRSHITGHLEHHISQGAL